MALKFKFKSKDAIPAEQQALYVERDGAWMLDVDGAADKALQPVSQPQPRQEQEQQAA